MRLDLGEITCREGYSTRRSTLSAPRADRGQRRVCAASDARPPTTTRPDALHRPRPAAMEPPAKRMRILQSIGVDEVDETNPEYIKGKQQNGEWLKNKFEAIYAKFGAMPDMMSDEMDMRGDGAIVVDRGHMRKLDKEYRNRLQRRRITMPDESDLIDDMFAHDKEMDMDEEEEEDEDGRDELAPSQSPEPMLPKSTTDHHPPPLAPSNGQADIPVPNTPTSAALQATLATSANPAADLLQLIQFPQTPAGQQARKAFEAQTAQAVQQAIASIFSSLLSTVPTFQSPQLQPLQAPETPAVSVETRPVAPATAPSLYRPPPVTSNPPASRSSPVPVYVKRAKRSSFAVGVHVDSRRRSRSGSKEDAPLFADHSSIQSAPGNVNEVSAEIETIDLPESKAQPEPSEKSQRRKVPKYVFTAEDDLYIIESRVIHKRPWLEVIDSKTKWKGWHLSTFWHRWSNKLKQQAAERERSGEPASLQARIDAGEVGSSMNELPEETINGSISVRHLPTPSSLGHDDHTQPDHEPDLETPEDLIASGSHFDDDERDLLSLHGEDPTHDIQTSSFSAGDTDSDLENAREIPETPLNLTQETSSQAIIQGIVTREATLDAAPSSQTTQPPPRKDGTSRLAPAGKTPHASSWKQPSPTTTQTPTPTIHTCSLCRQTFPTAALLSTHSTHPHPREIHHRDTLASSPPAIKREPLDFDKDEDALLPSTISLSTPTSTAHPLSSLASTGTPKSATKLSRKDYNAVKRAWARGKGRGGTPATAKRKRVSAGGADGTPRKRVWADGDASEDELGM